MTSLETIDRPPDCRRQTIWRNPCFIFSYFLRTLTLDEEEIFGSQRTASQWNRTTQISVRR